MLLNIANLLTAASSQSGSENRTADGARSLVDKNQSNAGFSKNVFASNGKNFGLNALAQIDKNEVSGNSFSEKLSKLERFDRPVPNVEKPVVSPVRNFRSEADVNNNSSSDNQAPTTAKYDLSTNSQVNSINSDINNDSENAIDAVQNSSQTTQDVSNNKAVDETQEERLSILRNALDRLKANGEISDEDAKIIESMLPGIISQNLDNGADAESVIARVLGLIAGAKKDSTSGDDVVIDDILDKMNLAKSNDKNDGSSLGAAILAPVNVAISNNADIKNLATTIITKAKEDASKPLMASSVANVSPVFVLNAMRKLKQEDALSGDTMAKGDGLFDPAVKTSDILTKSSDFTFSNNDLLGQRKDNITGLLGQNSGFGGLASVANTAFSSTQGSLQYLTNNVAGNSITAGVVNAGNDKILSLSQDNLTQNFSVSSLDKISGMLGSDNSNGFIKFQDLIQDGHVGNIQNNFQAHKAEDVLAQIKFGLGNSANDESNVSIQLHPKELGKVDINMHIANDGKTYVTVIAERTDTLNLLQKESASLKDMLTDALKTDSGSLSFSFHDGRDGNWQQDMRGNYSAKNQVDSAYKAANEIVGTRNYYQMEATTGIDIKV